MSKVFEFHFNPLSNPDLSGAVFNTFCFLPSTRPEKRLGSLYLIGEIKQPFPGSKELLSQLASAIQHNFYTASHPAEAFQLGLNSANNFIAQEIERGNFELLGHLSFAALSISPKCSVFFSKVGSIKILLLRQAEVFDMAPEPNPNVLAGRIFPNIIEGVLKKKDRVLILTENVFTALQEEKILEQLVLAKTPQEVNQIFREKNKILKEFSGACLLSFIKKTREPFALQKPQTKAAAVRNPGSYAPAGKLEKGIIAGLVLIILLLLGSLLF